MLDVRLSTILFQALNFFILLVLLQRFLYRPLLQVMRQREAAVAAALREAERRAEQAADERQQLAAARVQAQSDAEQVLAQARTEAKHAGERLLAEAEAEGARRLADVDQRIGERERAALAGLERQVTETAMALAADLIGHAAGPAVHQALLAEVVKQGLRLPPEQANRFRQAVSESGGEVVVELAYAATPSWQADCRAALAPYAEDAEALHVACQVNPALVAGVRFSAGTTVVELSVAGTLRSLAGSAATLPNETPAQPEPAR